MGMAHLSSDALLARFGTDPISSNNSYYCVILTVLRCGAASIPVGLDLPWSTLQLLPAINTSFFLPAPMPLRRRRPSQPPQLHRKRSLLCRTRLSLCRVAKVLSQQPYASLLVAIFGAVLYTVFGPRAWPSPWNMLVLERTRDVETDGAIRMGDDWGQPVNGYSVVAKYPHDRGAFTQGLLVENGQSFVESTGLYGRSEIRIVDLEHGKVVCRARLGDDEFGEGVARVWEGRYIQVLWKLGRGWIWEIDEAHKEWKKFGKVKFDGDAWGLAADGEGHLYLSDGSDVIRVMKLVKDNRRGWVLQEVRRIRVTEEGGRGVSMLNELEMVEGELWANVYFSELVVRIDQHSGKVLGWVDFGGLLSENETKVDVLNGIAYDNRGKRLFVTGKLWPWLFEVKVDYLPKYKHVGMLKPFFFDSYLVKQLQDSLE